MFDTEKFITEVQYRPCLWNLKEKCYSDRQAKRRAWEEIAEIMFVEWEIYDAEKKNETLVDLQKKWKHLRDYYVRERKKETDGCSGSAVSAKKRKTPYIEMLRFLDVMRQMRSTRNTEDTSCKIEDTSCNIEDTTCNIEDSFEETSAQENLQHDTESESSDSDDKTSNREVQIMTPFQRSLINIMEKSSTDNSDSDKQFLLSLLPLMKNMSEEKNFDFRIDVMRLVKKYRFGTTSPV